MVKLDPLGNHVYSSCFGQPQSPILHIHIAADAAGNAFFVGTFSGTVDFGSGPQDSSAGAFFVAKLDPMGGLLWLKTLGGPGGSMDPRAISVSGSDLLLAGDLYGSIDLGGGPLVNAGLGPGTSNVLVARLDANGGHVWSHAFASTDDQKVVAASTDEAGNLVVTGGMNGTVDFGGKPLTSTGYADIFLASFDPSGQTLWSKRFGGPNADVGRAVACDGAGNVVLLAEPGTSLDFGGGALETEPLGFVVARFDATGTFLDNRFLGSAQAHGVAARGQRVAMIGAAGGALDLGAGVLSFGAGGQFVAAWTP